MTKFHWAVLFGLSSSVATVCSAPPSMPSRPVMTQPTQQVPSPKERKMPTAFRDVNGTRFAFESHGTGKPIIFLHGLPTDRRSMVSRYEPMFADGSHWRRVYVDLPGTGETPGSPSIRDLDAYIDLIARFIDAEAQGEKVAVLGTSWGGYFALAYTHRSPEKVAGLAAIVTPMRGELPPRSIIAPNKALVDQLPPPLATQFTAVATVQEKRVVDTITENIVPGAKSADHAFLGVVLSTRPTGDKEILSVHHAGPALFVSGRQDSMCGYANAFHVAEGFPRATVAVLDRAAHALQIEQEHLLRVLFHEWLARLRETAGEGYINEDVSSSPALPPGR